MMQRTTRNKPVPASIEQAAATPGLPPTMTAAVIAAPGEVRLEERPLPEPGAGEVLVALEGCGVCASNLPVWEGREWFTYPLEAGTPGHEGWGVVARLGPGVRNVAVGERVAILSGHAYATHDIAQVESLVKLPPALAGQPFPAEPLACAINILARSQILPGDYVAIIGIGFLGAVLTRLAARAGAVVIAISRREYALNVAERFGATHTIPMVDHQQIINRVMELTDRKGCACVIEAVGTQWPLDLAGELTAVRGRLVIAGYHQDGPRQVNMQLWNWRGLDVINAHERNAAIYRAGMESAVKAVTYGELDPTPLFTHTLPLGQLDKAFAMLKARPDGFMKALITL